MRKRPRPAIELDCRLGADEKHLSVVHWPFAELRPQSRYQPNQTRRYDSNFHEECFASRKLIERCPGATDSFKGYPMRTREKLADVVAGQSGRQRRKQFVRSLKETAARAVVTASVTFAVGWVLKRMFENSVADAAKEGAAEAVQEDASRQNTADFEPNSPPYEGDKATAD